MTISMPASIYSGLRRGGSQGSFHLPSYATTEGIVASCELRLWLTDRFAVAVVICSVA